MQSELEGVPTCDVCNSVIFYGDCECDLKASEIVARLTDKERAIRATVAVLDIAARGEKVLTATTAAHVRDMLIAHHKRIAELEAELATARNEVIEDVATKTAGVAVDVMFSGKTAPADYAEAYAAAIRALKSGTTP